MSTQIKSITPELIREVESKSRLLFSQETIKTALDKMAQVMHKELATQDPIFLTVMNGGLFVMSELCLRLNFPLQMDYVHATRYNGEVNGATIHWKHEPSLPLEGRTVVIVDDILDGGITLKAITDYCYAKNATKVYTAVLMDKVNARLPEGTRNADFTAVFEENNAYVYGFGLDYHDYLRNIPGIYAVAEEHMF